MKAEMLRRARRNWCTTTVPMSTNRANIRKWVRAVRMLGDRWILAKQVTRKEV